MVNEDLLVEKARTDDEAFGVLYDFYFQKIYAYTSRRVGHRQTTEDLVSQIFIKAFTKLDTYKKSKGSFKSWLYRVATNTIIDHYRKSGRKKEVGIDSVFSLESSEKLPDHVAEETFESKKISKVISRLKIKEQEIIQLKFFAELSNIEIAETLRISHSYAGVRIYRALKSFKQEL